MKLPLLAVLAAASLAAAIDGTVVNKTTGKPQAGLAVNLMKLSRGMEQAGTVQTDAQGRWSFNVTADPQTPFLVQVFHEGISYSKMVQPGMPTNGVTVDVFNATPQPGGAKVTEDIIFLQPSPNGLVVDELIVFTNDGNTTYNDPKGTVRFFLPPGANGQVKVSVNGPNSMSLQKQAARTAQPNIYSVAHPIKPGSTRFDVNYTLPAAEAFETRVLHDAPIRVVVPPGVTLGGEGLQQIGQDPQTKAVIYSLKQPDQQVKVALTGTAAPAPPAASAEEEAGNSIEQRPARLYGRFDLILALIGTMLMSGFVLLYRKA